MSCTGPTTKNVLLKEVLEAVFQLRDVPFPGASPEDVYTIFTALYPDSAFTEADVAAAQEINNKLKVVMK